MTETDTADLEVRITRLETKRDALFERLTAIERDYRQGLEADSEERAMQLENAEVLEAIARSTREELDAIENQLRMLRGSLSSKQT